MFGSELKEKLKRIFEMPEEDSPNAKVEEPDTVLDEQFESSPVSILYVNNNLKISKINMTASHTLGAQTGELIGRPFLGFIELESAEIFLNSMRKALLTSQRQAVNLKLRTVEGRVFPGECEIIAVFNENSTIESYRIAIIEKTEPVKPEDLIH